MPMGTGGAFIRAEAGVAVGTWAAVGATLGVGETDMVSVIQL